MKKLISLFFISPLMFILSCNKEQDLISTQTKQSYSTQKVGLDAVIPFLENMETGSKTAYTAANVTLTTGSWNLNDALLGNSSSDVKDGTQSARVRNNGTLTMEFDKTTGAGTVTVYHAKYGSDASSQWQLWYSTNNGSTFVQSGSTITTSTTTLTAATFTLNVTGNVRIEIKKTDGSTNRINFDDISISDYSSGTNNPLPTLTSISPATATAGSAAFTLTVSGTNFINSSAIQWNGSSLATTYVSATQLTATVPATDVANTGSATVTVFNPTPGGGTSSAATFKINAVTTTAKKFLFDASHAETAGNADWVIDEDGGTPQRIPTPAQSTITASTAETYWTGALSTWGIDLVKAGQYVETLPSSGSITYGSTSNAQDLSNYNVFVVDEPNKVFTSAQKTAILQFIQNGGSLLMISDHTQSDRDNDGWDSPAIWNDLMTNNSVQNDPFGFSVDITNISGISSNVLTGGSSNPILNGTQGTVSSVSYDNGATLTLHASDNSGVQGLIWKSGSTQNSSNVLCASSTFGAGRVFVITDSSPEDDGTGASGNTLYSSFTSYSHKQLLMNASLWLARLQ